MSTPISAIAAATAGLTWLAGSDPAEVTRTASPPSRASKAAAICDRPALWVHMNSTSGTSAIVAAFPLSVPGGRRDDPGRRCLSYAGCEVGGRR